MHSVSENTRTENSSTRNALYVVSTPIGNLDDISIRGINVLKNVGLIACEDKRHSLPLLRHLGVDRRLIAYHDHSGERELRAILDVLDSGQSVALISDAGTPLVADPGYKLINHVLESGHEVIPVPGASALLAALSTSGLPTDRFLFEGFLPAKQEARRKHLQLLADEPRTLVFYEAPHRIARCLQDMVDIFGSERKIAVMRELTKRFETKLRGAAAEVLEQVLQDDDQRRGEFVVVVRGVSEKVSDGTIDPEAANVLTILREELPLKQASALAAKITGRKKNLLYKWALENEESKS